MSSSPSIYDQGAYLRAQTAAQYKASTTQYPTLLTPLVTTGTTTLYLPTENTEMRATVITENGDVPFSVSNVTNLLSWRQFAQLLVKERELAVYLHTEDIAWEGSLLVDVTVDSCTIHQHMQKNGAEHQATHLYFVLSPDNTTVSITGVFTTASEFNKCVITAADRLIKNIRQASLPEEESC